MLCQECGLRPATVHLTQIINNEKTELHLCDKCAAKMKKEKDLGSFDPGFSIHNLLAGMLNFDFNKVGNAPTELPAKLQCENCGLTFAQFSQIGRFGCSRCYTTFGDKLDPLLRRIHGNIIHTGKIPRREGSNVRLRRQVEDIRRQLQRKVETEEFEEAARLRDQLRELQLQLKQEQDDKK